MTQRPRRPDRRQYPALAVAGAVRGRLRRAGLARPLPSDGYRSAGRPRACTICWRPRATAGFAGVNVTFPFKEAVVAAARRGVGRGAADRRGQHRHHRPRRRAPRATTPTAPASAAASRRRSAATPCAGKTALLVGAGGAGRAVAFALFDLGVATLLVNDRNEAQARGPLRRPRGAFRAATDAARARPVSALATAAGLVNATPVGMTGIPGLPMSPARRAGPALASPT